MQIQNAEKFLKEIELFSNLSEKEIMLLEDVIEIKNYNPDEMLFEENTRRDALFVIYDGQVQLSKKTPSGEERTLAIFGKSDFLGEGSLMDDYPHSTTAKVVKPSVILKFQIEKLRTIFETKPQLYVKILSRTAYVIARRMRQTTNQVVDAAAQYISGKTRQEHDLLGYREVPSEALYGVQTLRGLENFEITGVSINHSPSLIKALAQIKLAAAKANFDLGLLNPKVFKAISQACEEIVNGKFHTHFVVDMVQGGAGTSTNMNANEVIANRALEIMGYEKGQYEYCHPNEHVNLSQSTNDAYPSALKVALIYESKKLIEVLKQLISSFKQKANEFATIIKMGRTQLQDAVPMTLGQEFESYAVTLEEEVQRIEENSRLFLELNMGGTAIGTGINADPRYSELVIQYLWEITGLPVRLATNLVEATQDTGSFVMFSSAVKRLAVKLSKICNDLRLLSSGPRAGFAEIMLPPMQPGSSIMPGKVNPVIPEVVNQIAFKVIGNDLTVTLAAEGGQLQLNVFEPIIAQSLFESIRMLINGMKTLKTRAIDGIQANEKKCREFVEHSIGLVTALNPYLGYERSTEIAKEALENNRSVYELVLEKGYMTKEELDNVLNPINMIKPNFMTKL
jgi:aspartate ammonia-lyase